MDDRYYRTQDFTSYSDYQGDDHREKSDGRHAYAGYGPRNSSSYAAEVTSIELTYRPYRPEISSPTRDAPILPLEAVNGLGAELESERDSPLSIDERLSSAPEYVDWFLYSLPDLTPLGDGWVRVEERVLPVPPLETLIERLGLADSAPEPPW